jgi:hypothetical protein
MEKTGEGSVTISMRVRICRTVEAVGDAEKVTSEAIVRSIERTTACSSGEIAFEITTSNNIRNAEGQEVPRVSSEF